MTGQDAHGPWRPVPGEGNAGRRLVIGVGNEFRRDDGVGPAVVARLRASVPAGHRYELALDAMTGMVRPAASSHSISLGDTVELARALRRLPARLTILAVVGRDFGFGVGLSADVAAAVDPLVQRVRETVR